jgi:hypothetical protein
MFHLRSIEMQAEIPYHDLYFLVALELAYGYDSLVCRHVAKESDEGHTFIRQHPLDELTNQGKLGED